MPPLTAESLRPHIAVALAMVKRKVRQDYAAARSDAAEQEALKQMVDGIVKAIATVMAVNEKGPQAGNSTGRFFD